MLGPHVVRGLLAAGHEVRVLSRQDRPPVPEGVEVVQGDLATEEGLAGAVTGADVVVHAASAPFGRQRKVNVEGTRAIAEHALHGGGRPHVVYPSIVGCDRIPLRYYRTKAAAEKVLAGSGLPWTVARFTQFHELLHAMVRKASRGPLLAVPGGFRFQPLAAAEAAQRLVELAGDEPAGRVDDAGGPEVRGAADLARAFLRHSAARARVVELTAPGRVAAAFRAGLNTAPEHAVGTVTWEDFLAATPAS